MTELPPPPRRPAPPELADRIQAELADAPESRFRPRLVVIPLVAASLVGVVALGVPQVVQRLDPGPTIAAGPTPTSSPSETSTPTPAPTPHPSAGPPELGIRAMTKAEIKADLKSCTTPAKGDTAMPRQGKLRTVFAQVQRPAGLDRPLRERHRVLVVADDIGRWSCLDGTDSEWTRTRADFPKPTSATPVIDQSSGGWGGSCGGDVEENRSGGESLFQVTDKVVSGQVRVSVGKQRGPWQTTAPADGYLRMDYAVVGAQADQTTVKIEFRFLDRNGDRLWVGREAGGSRVDRTRTPSQTWESCVPRRLPPAKALKRPASQAAGVRNCLKLGRTATENRGGSFGDGWKAKLVVSTDQEWGAVLSNGTQRFGCSLFPTKEVSALSNDTRADAKRDFFFALNPIAKPEGESLWAAGRVPDDISKITYLLPGKRVVEAKLRNGYWMMKSQATGSFGTGDVAKWDPVEVELTRGGSTEVYTIPFKVSTMCNQVSHGC